MARLAQALLEAWRRRRQARATEVLDDLKLRYHTFRVLLANNERSLDLLRLLELSLASSATSRAELSDRIDELLSVTYELVDGLNRLTENRYGALYDRHQAMEEAVRKSFDALSEERPRMARTIFLDNATGDHKASLGSKAATLGILKKAGFPVPDGFAVPAEVCGEVLAVDDLETHIRSTLQLLENGGAPVAEAEAEAMDLQRRILDTPLPAALEAELRSSYERISDNGKTAVSVRSSALVEDRPEHSFAGQFKSILNVTSLESFLSAFKEVLAGNFSPRAVSYRLHAGLPQAGRDMAVLCQRMIEARTAGGLFTVDPADPESGRMLVSAVPGLGISAVSGSAPADLYRPLRDGPDREPMEEWAQLVKKTHRAVNVPGGGIRTEEVPEAERDESILSEREVLTLARMGRRIESLLGKPQDIEWAMAADGEIRILQSRDIRLSLKDRRVAEGVKGKPLLSGGVGASPGRCVGRIKIVHSAKEVEEWRRSDHDPAVLVLHQSLVDAAGWLPDFEGVVVDLGNPTDHLSCVAREYSIPMLTGTGRATELLKDGEWVILDADTAVVLQAPEEVWSDAESVRPKSSRSELRRRPVQPALTPELSRLRNLIEPLNLTDAYGPTFSISECRSLHDIIRYIHEMAILAMFRAGDEVLEEAESIVRRLDEGVPFSFLIIDLGGGIITDRKGMKVKLEDILSVPLLALWKGMSTPGLRWNEGPPVPGVAGLFSRSLLDSGGSRPVGSQNYTLITRDYLNLNARVDYHFAMVDTVCGSNSRENYVRFRFKGGGTTVVQRERRVLFMSEVLEEYRFVTSRQGDLITASIQELPQPQIEELLVMVGRLLGFSRLLDAAMSDDTVPKKLVRAFLQGDYGLQSLSAQA